MNYKGSLKSGVTCLVSISVENTTFLVEELILRIVPLEARLLFILLAMQIVLIALIFS